MHGVLRKMGLWEAAPSLPSILPGLRPSLWKNVERLLIIARSTTAIAAMPNASTDLSAPASEVCWRPDPQVLEKNESSGTRGLKLPSTLLCLSLCLSGLVHAEGRCPEGYFPIGGGNAGWEGCAPMGPISEQGESAQPQEPQWATRWGAIAVGGGGGFGAAADMTSKRKAEKQAIAQCKATATDRRANCTVLAYYNQCAVYAWGSAGGEIVSEVNVSKATSVALEKCSERANDCKIYYSNCSYAQRVN